MFVFQALQHGFFDFETFDVDEYEHYEVSGLSRAENISYCIHQHPLQDDYSMCF